MHWHTYKHTKVGWRDIKAITGALNTLGIIVLSVMVPSLQWRIWAWMHANRSTVSAFSVTKCVRWKKRQKWLRKQCMRTCVCVWWGICGCDGVCGMLWVEGIGKLLFICFWLYAYCCHSDGESQASDQLMDDLMIYTQWKSSEETLTCISFTSVSPFAHTYSQIHPTTLLHTTSVSLICIRVFVTVLWHYWFLSELKMTVSVAT